MEKWTSNYCSQNEEDEYVYPDEKWTENQPPQGIILPCYYDGKQWVGQTQDELEKMLPEVEIPVDDKDIAIAKLTSLVVDLQRRSYEFEAEHRTNN